MYALPFLIPPAFLLGMILLGRLERWLDEDLTAQPDRAVPVVAVQPAVAILEAARN